MPNPGNDFWKLIGAVLNQTFAGLSYGDKIELLKANRIGLCEAFQTCVRPGSMASDMTEHELNDFEALKTLAELQVDLLQRAGGG